MGKTRKSKPKTKVNPVGIPSLQEALEDEFENDDHPETAVGTMSEQLQSAIVEEKMCGLQSLAFLSLNETKVAGIVESELVKIAAPLLMDPNKNIRNATAGAMRNLSCCGTEVCDSLVEQDVLTALLTLLSEYAAAGDWTPTFDANNQLDQSSDTFLHAVNILLNLCESTSDALDSFNQTNLLPTFIRCLDNKVFGLDIATSVAQCLVVISEDNSSAWNVLSEHALQLLAALSVDETEQSVLLRTLSAAIISNIPALASGYNNQILKTLSITLDINYRTSLNKLTSLLPVNGKRNELEIEVADETGAMEQETNEQANRRRLRQDLPTDLDNEIKHIGWILEAQRVAAETITNLCSTDDDDGEGMSDGESDAESVHDYDNSGSEASASFLNKDTLPVEILESLQSFALVEKLWQRAQPMAENVQIILQESEKSVLKKLKNLRVSALLCLQNLCDVMSTEDLGGPSAIYKVWMDLGQQVFQGTQDIQILEASTALMRAALEHLRTSQDLFKPTTENDLQMILTGIQSCNEPEIRANWLRMLGVLGCLLTEDLVKVIITFILEHCAKETDAWTLSEAIDALMDMFADNDWDKIANEVHLAKKAKELEKLLKIKAQQQKRELSQRHPVVCTVRTNLVRFTKYVESQQRKYKSK